MGETLPNKNDRDVSVEMQPPDPEAPVRLATFDQYRSLLFSVAYRMLGSVGSRLPIRRFDRRGHS